MPEFTGGFQTDSELLAASRFIFEAPGKVEARAILEITGLSIECPPANSNAVMGSLQGGQTRRQATPTRQKFNVLSLKLVLEETNLQLFEWYTQCNNESNNQSWRANRQDASIQGFSQQGAIAAEWSIKLAYPVKYAGPEFKAGDETMANETIDIVYEDFEKIT
jgi:phage tail-like protein